MCFYFCIILYFYFEWLLGSRLRRERSWDNIENTTPIILHSRKQQPDDTTAGASERIHMKWHKADSEVPVRFGGTHWYKTLEMSKTHRRDRSFSFDMRLYS